MRFGGKTALVTGAGSGINREIAQAFAREGAAVICADRDGAAAVATSEKIRASGGAGEAVTCDVTIESDIENAVRRAASVGDGLDILVNGAGILQAQPVLDVTRKSFQAVFDVNVVGLFFMLQESARAMIAAERQGRIINIASIAGRQGNGSSLQYCASKAAVISMTQSAGQGLAPFGITVNAIAPGFVQTRMWTEMHEMAAKASPGASADQFDEQLALRVAAGRLGLPSDLISTALFLASQDAHYVVGQTINVDGGVQFN